jgi:peptide/nickel transport system substrate-binding protein
MQRRCKFNLSGSQILGGVAAGLLLAGVACGSAAAPATSAPATVAPAAPEVAEPAAVPTAAAQGVQPSAEVTVNPGKVTWMIGAWGNERFTYNYSVGGGNNYARIMHGFLIATNERTELLPGIASSWDFSPDGRTWTVTVREGAKFHDGALITAEDVWWSWMHYWGKDQSGSALDRVTQSSAQSMARVVETIEQPASDQVSITTTVADAGFPAAMISESAGNWYGVVPKRPLVHNDAQESAYDLNPIAAGPMKLVRHVPAERMQFERFGDYYYQPAYGLPEDRRVKFTALDLVLVPEESTRAAAIRAGDADIAPITLATREQVEAGGARVVFGKEGVYMYIRQAGCFKPQFPCSKKAVRQALAYAFDKELMRDRLFGGLEAFQAKGWTHVTPSSIGYSPELDPYPFDPEKARQLLAEAGYPGGEGFGKLIVNTWVSSSMPFLPESAQLIADSWRKELGLDMEVRVGDESALKEEFLTDRLHGQILIRDNETRLDGSSSQRSSYGTPEHAGRLHENPDITKMVLDSLAVFDPDQRAVAFNEGYKRLREESYDISVGYANIPWAVGPRVAEWQPRPLAFYPSELHTMTLK